MKVITAPPPSFEDLTKEEVIQTLQLARRRIYTEEDDYVCTAISYAHLHLNHETRWPSANAYHSSLIKWVGVLLEKKYVADAWLRSQGFMLTEAQMRKWRFQWLTLMIEYVIQHPKKFFKNLPRR